MNKRIKALIEQATTMEVTSGRGFDTTQYIDRFDKEKFAELIVQDCIDIISPYSVRMSRPGEEYLHPIQEIKQHFGVGE